MKTANIVSMVDDVDFKSRVAAILDRIHEKQYIKQNNPYIADTIYIINSKLRTKGGYAMPNRQEIHINYRLYKANSDKHLEDMLAHEIAHMIAYHKFNDRGHGLDWKLTMQHMGYMPDRCHKLDVSEFRRSQTRHAYTCPCNKPRKISTTKHNRILRGLIYRCTACKLAIYPIKGSL